MAWLRRFLAGAAASAMALAVATMPAQAEPEKLGLKTQRLPWNADDRTDTDVGAFEWMGSIVVSSDRKRFGGWSGIAVSADGSSLLAVSENGRWFSAKILYDEKERIAGIGDGKIGPLPGLDGKPIARAIGYASGIVADSINLQSGYAYVSFNRNHRIWRYPLTQNGIEGKPKVVVTGAKLGNLSSEGGIGGMALMDGAGLGSDPRAESKPLLAVTENSRDPRGNVRAFIIEGGARKRLSISLNDPYRPVDIGRLPGGDYLLLERHYSLLAGAAGIQIRRIAGKDVKPGAILQGDILLDAKGRKKIDNMEAMALRRGRNGEIWVYMISNSNFNQLQRTQLSMFRLKSPAPSAAATAP